MIARMACAFLFLALLLSACTSDLTADLNGKPCDAPGLCLDGYACDTTTNKCQRVATMVPAGGGNCQEGETVCDSKCVSLMSDENNCGACHTACSAPANGIPNCTRNSCKFVCEDGYQACGSVCVDFATD